ncbi:D-3-phosphoglycerate dehydrogenase 2 [Blastocladiella emersonii ATCC 22665]|nr:D-3-phosphoglycerate dehydrogenase 2 [Blastocladiella emersonii ATCC 22665]
MTNETTTAPTVNTTAPAAAAAAGPNPGATPAEVTAHMLSRRGSGVATDDDASARSGTPSMMSVLSPAQPSRNAPAAAARTWHALDQNKIKVLLLESVSPVAVATLEAAGYQVETAKSALSEDELVQRIGGVQVLGIRSKTQVTARVLAAARRLLAIGCFCIGTNQVNLAEASRRGVAVFNSPYANSRSVAEMTIANMVALARQLGDRNNEMHQGVWNKVSAGCYEVRGKTLGIVGYGHIGSQLSVLAEAMGLRVVYHDIQQIMPLGSARQLRSLEELLGCADFVTLHVPETPDTMNLITARELALMKKGAYLINASRGTVVDIPALAAALRSGHLAGAAVDVYPVEPAKNGAGFESPLLGCPNTLLSPHIGGSTEEAQRAIGLEVSRAVVSYVAEGNSQGSVNLPALALKPLSNPLTIRVTNIHRNVPGVLKKINLLLSDFNIERQSSEGNGDIAYLMADVTLDKGRLVDELQTIHQGISALEENILVRVFY